MFFLFVVLTLACSWAFAQAPTVSNVTMTQSPNATSTQVDIYYDLDAPNGPCAITVSLSKDGGADGFMHPVTSVVGDLSGVTTGTGYHIVWDIRADYPEEDLPEARLQVTADDGVVQHTLKYLAGPGGSIDGQFSLQQTVNHGADGAPVTAVPDEGYGFLQWSDGVLTAARTDTNVTADISVMASFLQLPPEVTSFNLDGGAATTPDLVVTLDNTATNNPAEYIVSEASDFSGATWQAYGTAPTFTLSSAEGGTKTVYFKVRNEAGESAPVSDAINLMGQTITLPGDVPLELVWVPAGGYQMGRYPGELDGASNEDPQHPVTLAYGFWMGKYEITQQQWLAVRGSWPQFAPSATYGIGDTYPAYWISWNDAKDFITSLNAHIVSSGQGPLTVRLPSEAEWEYACRAGTQTRFYWGDDLTYTAMGM